MRVATRTISALADGATTRELDELSIRTAAGLIVEEPNYSKLAARLLATYVDKEVRNQNIPWFSESVELGHELGLVGDDVLEFVDANAPELNAAINSERDRTSSSSVCARCTTATCCVTRTSRRHRDPAVLLPACRLWPRHRRRRGDQVLRPHVVARLPAVEPHAVQLRDHPPQMSSCYLLDSPEDSLEGIYKRYTDIAQLSKFAGGIGVAWHRIRSKGSLIRGTNGLSNGIVPWLKTLDSSVAAVNQGGRRKGAACVYLETWHADIEDFLELRDNTGDHARRTHNLNIANWIPDLFMERVEKDWQW